MAIARALTNSFSGIRPADLPGFIAAQQIGPVCALMVINWLLRKSRSIASSIKAEAKL